MSGAGEMERLGLLKSLHDLAKSGARLEASVLTTYAFNGLFYEEVLLRAFERAGSRLNIVLADAGQLAEAMADPLRRPSRAGRDYLLAPVVYPGAFHPKILALLSEKRPFLAIGSHNATAAGFSHNEEVTAFWGPDHVPISDVLRNAVEYALGFLRTGEAGSADVTRELEQRVRALLPQGPTAANAEITFMGGVPSAPLLEQLHARVSSPVSRIWVVGPYFDARLAFLRTLQAVFEPGEIIVGVQPETCLLPDPALAPPSVRFVDAADLSAFCPDPKQKVGFAHGKAVALQCADGLVVSVGSANPTGAAWLARPDGNAEANLCLTGKTAAAAFANLGLDRLDQAAPLAEARLQSVVERTHAQRALEQAAAEASRPPVLVGQWADAGLALAGPAPELPADLLLEEPGDGRPARVGLVVDEAGVRLAMAAPPAPGLHRLRAADETVAFVLVNDARALQAASLPRERQAILAHLGALDNNAAFTDLFDLLDRHVLGPGVEEPLPGPGRPSSGRQGAGGDLNQDAPYGPRGVSLSAAPDAENRQFRLKEGLISEIIATLLRALGAPPKPRTDGDGQEFDPEDADGGPSSDDLAANLEAEAVAEAIDWPRLVTACRKRLGLMIQRLDDRLAEAARGDRTPEWALGRLLVVLCLLQRLRGHLPGRGDGPLSGRAKPNSLVSEEHLRRAFSVAVRALYGRARLAEALETSTETRAAREREQLDNVLFWFAREIGADCAPPPMGKLDGPSLQAMADLIPVATSAAAHERLEVWAEHRDPWLAIWDDAPPLPPDWASRQLALGRCLQRHMQPLAAKVAPLKPGAIVAWQFEPWIVKAVRGRNVDLLGPGGEERTVREEALSLLDFAAEPAPSWARAGGALIAGSEHWRG